MGAALLVVPVGPVSAVPGGGTEVEVEVFSGIAMFDLPESFNMAGPPGNILTLTDFDYRVITNELGGYNVTVVADGDAFVGTGSNTDTIPIARLLARDDAPGEPGVPETPSDIYEPLSSTDFLTVHSQSGRSATDGDILSTGYQLVIPAVNADIYRVTLTYLAAVAG